LDIKLYHNIAISPKILGKSLAFVQRISSMSYCPTSTMRSLECTWTQDWVVIYRSDWEDRSAFTQRNLLKRVATEFH